ncbi:hypothetical protein H8959_007712 [Pygathrix nigripes]
MPPGARRHGALSVAPVGTEGPIPQASCLRQSAEAALTPAALPEVPEKSIRRLRARKASAFCGVHRALEEGPAGAQGPSARSPPLPPPKQPSSPVDDPPALARAGGPVFPGAFRHSPLGLVVFSGRWRLACWELARPASLKVRPLMHEDETAPTRKGQERYQHMCYQGTRNIAAGGKGLGEDQNI